MSAIKLEVNGDTEKLMKQLKKLQHIDKKGISTAMAEALRESTVSRFEAEQTPDGGQWKKFEVKRAGTVEFEKVPADGSKKMDDTLMESVEPYDFKEAVPFRMAYMAGYLADRYDVPKEECIGRAKKRIRRSTEREFRNTVKGYHVIDQEKANMEIKDQAKYALYPVWILNTTWKDKKYIFAMNGQTGKIVGDLPADNGAFWRFVAMWGAGIGLVLYALLWVFMVLL